MKDLSQSVQKRNQAETPKEKWIPIPKHTIKDSVFTSLFQEKKYLLELYRTLHPEDKKATEDSLRNITMKNVLTDGIYNDLGFLAGDRLLILVEAQTTWTVNIILRALLYLAQTYQDYFNREKADLYRSKKVKVPKPELYVIYTGRRGNRPERISLTKEFFRGEECALEVTIQVLYGDPAWEDTTTNDKTELDIIQQYIFFTKVYNEQLVKYKRTKKAITETIRICKEQNVLKEYLESREKEVVDIMSTLFDEERILQIHIENRVKEAAERAARKAAKAAAKAAAKKAAKEVEEVKEEARIEAKIEAKKEAEEAAKKMLKTGKLTIEEIADCLTGLSAEDVERIKEKLEQKV